MLGIIDQQERTPSEISKEIDTKEQKRTGKEKREKPINSKVLQKYERQTGRQRRPRNKRQEEEEPKEKTRYWAWVSSFESQANTHRLADSNAEGKSQGRNCQGIRLCILITPICDQVDSLKVMQGGIVIVAYVGDCGRSVF